MATLDLQLFGPDGFTLDQSSFAPTAVGGADKVAQRLLYYLLTPAGTIPGQASCGTNFMTAVYNFRSEFDLFVAFSAAEPIAAANVQACELTTDPSSDRYGSAQLSSISIDTDSITISIDVTALDGSTPADPVSFTLNV